MVGQADKMWQQGAMLYQMKVPQLMPQAEAFLQSLQQGMDGRLHPYHTRVIGARPPARAPASLLGHCTARADVTTSAGGIRGAWLLNLALRRGDAQPAALLHLPPTPCPQTRWRR